MRAASDATSAVGLLAVAAAAFLWATLGVAGKALYAVGAEPLVVVAWRAILAVLVLGAGLAILGPGLPRLPPRALPFFALYGLVAASNYACYFLALRHVPVAVAIMLLYTYPSFVAVAARFFFAEPLSPAKTLALGLSFAGVVLVGGGFHVGAAHVSLPGVLYGLGAAVAMAAYSLLGKRATRDHDPWTVVLFSLAGAALLLAAALGRRLTRAFAYTPLMWAGLVYLAVGPTLLAYGLFLWALRRVEVSGASVWTTLEPPMAAALAFVFLGEVPGTEQVVGGVLILTGVGILQWRSAPPAPA
ncbi:MAG: DMT family transporter [Armatimonadota bacterium]|nr:DMT family transporter [Armatimonadota bacterium]MDR7518960.1 DMT family transporter [Armatimonadota bacterium]MDR7548569.1 DMT family transporter [Armatimonadota bacterium]